MDSVIDVLAAIVLLLAIMGSDRPADNEHRYGHGKYEALAGFLRSLFVLLSAVYISYRGIMRLDRRDPLLEIEAGMVVMGLSLFLTLLVFLYQSYVARKTGSLAIAADRLNYLGDLGSGFVVLAGIFLEGFFGIRGADVLGGLFLAFYLGYGAWQILREAMAVLLDRDISSSFEPVVSAFVAEHPGLVLGFHDVRARTSGNTHFLELHLEIQADLAFRESHQLVEALMRRLQASHPDLQVIVHAEPAIPNGPARQL